MKGHGKGGEFERNTARMLSSWLSNGADDSWIWRTSQSGGRATQRAKQGKTTSGAYGDLTFTDEGAKWFFDYFVLELKRGYSATNALDLIDGKQKEPALLAFWEQSRRDKIKAERPYSFVILKRDHKSICGMLEYTLFSKLSQHAGKFNGKSLVFNLNEDKIVLFLLTEFLEWIDPELLQTVLTTSK